ncbi:MAG TPA: glycoside hydrolase TIM-barrel-like domain-containing protein [Micropepsaceae bacterium]|jgi:hypothetical protein
MATLILESAGQAVGALFGGSVGGIIGSALGALAGASIDNALFATHGTANREGARLSDVSIQASTEGAAIPVIYGRVRVAGEIIWATRFKETAVTTSQSAGGGKGGGGGTTVVSTDYLYSISFAVGLCEGIVHQLGRVWADGKLFDLSKATTRFYPGTQDQGTDPLIEEIEGAGNTPAYRGLCHIVFEDLPLAEFGNRIPQLQFELIRSLSADNPDSLESRLGGVALIPGAGEFVYATDSVNADDGQGGTASQNVHGASGVADIVASLNDLETLAPNLGAVSLVVGWFGDDLRAGHCTVKPGVEVASKTTYPQDWSVNGVARADAHLVSQVEGRPAYGGTPSDASVVQAIAALRARGWRVMFCPFLFMDVPDGNTLSDPYTGAAGQPAYPWRGRVVCDPAPGVAGSPDKTSAAATQVNAFFGSASAGDFSVSGTKVSWTGGTDWGWRRMVLHYAHLCAAAGGADAFLIGSEFTALNHVRSSSTAYPAVAALKTLAADVRGILGEATRIGYAADWSEYNNHQTGDAPGAVLFHLDALWADANIDFVGIDNYMKLSDWRDGTAHADYDAVNGPTDIHDPAYLAANIAGGEDFDWYYASDADRLSQTRTSITDGVAGKPWVFRAKDLVGWWSNAHYDRANGTEAGSPTAWVPQGKPIWFTEIGCPAIDKGANQPNVFFDPKSSESAVPYFSNAGRDDLIQRRFLEAHLKYWSDTGNNPVSGVYTASMVDIANIYAWTWDARPFPFFPARGDVWGDTANYRLGHWLNGRLGSVLLADLVADICRHTGFADFDTADLSGLVTGYLIGETMSPRDQIEPLGLAFHFDAVESEGIIRFLTRGQIPVCSLTEDDLALPEDQASLGANFVRAQDADLPNVSRISYIDAGADYRESMAEAHRLTGGSNRVAQSALPLVLDQGEAIGIGERLLQDAWVARETANFALPPARIALDPADEVTLAVGGRTRRLRVTEIGDAGPRAIAAVMTDPSIYETLNGPDRGVGALTGVNVAGRAILAFLDLPLLTGTELAYAPHVAAYATPWPGSVLVYRSTSDANYALDTQLATAAIMGELRFDFYAGATGRWDKGNQLWLTLYGGTLSCVPDIDVFAGTNTLAIENGDGEWEIVQFRDAELVGSGQWKLTTLLRGQAGTESAMRNPVGAGARIVVLDRDLPQLHLSLDSRALPFFYRWGPNGKAISDATYQTAQRQFVGIGLRPLSPVQIRARWPTVAGDIVISWKRRTRIGGDSWEQLDVPLGEDSENYEVDIFNGATVVRTLQASMPQATYTFAQQTSDFGAQQWSVTVAIYQISAVFGRGAQRKATLFY